MDAVNSAAADISEPITWECRCCGWVGIVNAIRPIGLVSIGEAMSRAECSPTCVSPARAPAGR